MVTAEWLSGSVVGVGCAPASPAEFDDPAGDLVGTRRHRHPTPPTTRQPRRSSPQKHRPPAPASLRCGGRRSHLFCAPRQGTQGMLLGGLLTQYLTWRWIFLSRHRLAGAVTVSGGLVDTRCSSSTHNTSVSRSTAPSPSSGFASTARRGHQLRVDLLSRQSFCRPADSPASAEPGPRTAPAHRPARPATRTTRPAAPGTVHHVT